MFRSARAKALEDAVPALEGQTAASLTRPVPFDEVLVAVCGVEGAHLNGARQITPVAIGKLIPTPLKPLPGRELLRCLLSVVSLACARWSEKDDLPLSLERSFDPR